MLATKQQLTTERATSSLHTTADLQADVKRWPDEAARAWTFDAVKGATANETIKAIVATGSSVHPSVAEARERAQKARHLYQKMIEVGDTDAAADLQLSMLTFLGRASLSEANVFPKSRPELPNQLHKIGNERWPTASSAPWSVKPSEHWRIPRSELVSNVLRSARDGCGFQVTRTFAALRTRSRI